MSSPRPEPIVVIGAGGHRRETVSLIRESEVRTPGRWELLGVVVDDAPNARLNALQVGWLGTANRLEEAREGGVETVVNISTDKAANPTSMLGYSKRKAERLTAGVAQETPGKFVSVRFGNVLDSRGLVPPAFTDQIAHGGSETVTHPDATRFFMMIPETCELVIRAAAAGDGEAMVLEMGQPVRILDVALQMIEVSGRKDIEIVFTGPREGQKLHEELFGQAEGQRRTSHELIDAVPMPGLGIAEVRASGTCWNDAQGAA